MKQGKIIRGLSWVCLMTAVGLLAWSGMAPQVLLEARASSRHADWNRFWQAQNGPARLSIPGDPLPTNLPGPLDAWAGGMEHRIELTFDAPPGKYRLELTSYDAHEAAPPLLSFRLNEDEVRTIRITRGKGKSAPYAHVDPNLTIFIPLTIAEQTNTLVVANTEGSWLAPARLRLLGPSQFHPAKLGWEILSNSWVIGSLVLSLLGFVFFRAMASGGLGIAAFSALLAVLMAGSTLAACEFLFRLYLVKVPEARIVNERQVVEISEAMGSHYTYATMIQPNPHLDIIYTLKPNLNGFFAGHPLQTNQHFMRGPEAHVVPDPAGLRIMGLGDSVMFGWGVAWEKVALTRLGGMLSEILKVPVETLNLGCPSYNAANNVASYARMGRKFSPRLVTMIIIENDFSFPGAMIEPVRLWSLNKSYAREQMIRYLAANWRDGSAAYEQFVSARHLQSIEDKKDQELDQTQRWHRQVSEYYQGITGFSAMEASLFDLAAMLKSDGALGLVVYNPINVTLDRPDTYEPKYAAFVVDTARRAGLLAVDMAPVYEQYLKTNGYRSMDEALWFRERDWHPNEVAHELMAETMLDILQDEGAIKSLLASFRE